MVHYFCWLQGCGSLSPGVCPDRWGFCGWSFLNDNHELLVVEDLKRDARQAASSSQAAASKLPSGRTLRLIKLHGMLQMQLM